MAGCPTLVGSIVKKNNLQKIKRLIARPFFALTMLRQGCLMRPSIPLSGKDVALSLW